MLKTALDIDENDYKGIIFKGTVIANDDSQETEFKNTEKIKVQIPGLYDSDDPAQLPWCVPLKDRIFGSKSGQGTFGVPSIGSIVAVILQQGDPHNPAYIGSILLEGATIAEFLVNYPNRYGFKDPAGNIFYIDTTSGQVTVHFQHKSGTTIHIDDAGNVTQTIVGNLTQHVEGNVDQTVDGSLTQHVNGNVDQTVDGATNLTASGGLNITADTVFTGTINANGRIIDERHTHNFTDSHGDSGPTGPVV
jgi:hypothetical protein